MRNTNNLNGSQSKLNTSSSNPKKSRSAGRVVRVVPDVLAYVSTLDDNRILSFTPSVVDNFRGETLGELNIQEGTGVDLEWDRASGIVTRVYPDRSPSDLTALRSGETSQMLTKMPARSDESYIGTIQHELCPDEEADEHRVPLRALPIQTRQFGKLVDTSNLRPGDLLLSRELKPDKISKLISGVQGDGGYHADDSRWTHAAMYVGDGFSVVEATFEDLLSGGDVRLTSLDAYCDGLNCLRFRRSRFLLTELEGWRICVRALSRLKTSYSFTDAVRMWYNIVVKKRGFFDSDRWIPFSSAVVCSTLYADAYNESTRRSLGEVSGVCVPAWLSLSEEFDDVDVKWIGIK
jgi:hypothetical protein